jgi:hypothetical protein
MGESQVELNEHPGADAAPPALRIGPSLIPHTAVDWKAPGLPAFAIDHSQDPSKFGSIACGKRLSLELSSVAAPAALEVSVFRGNPAEINPVGPPDAVIDLVASDRVTRETLSHGSRYSFDCSALGISGEATLGIFAQYYADPSLEGERFTNTVGWIVWLSD